ncbi:MAG TPA: universal stress protein [Actinoplanes sp.]|nr:universal stress protein [Actinoplanes sp.]
MTEQPQPGAEGPVVIGFDGTGSGEDAIALGLLVSRGIAVPAIVAVVYPGPAPISPARVDAEWVADRRRAAEQILDQARVLTGSAAQLDYRVVASSSGAHGLHDVAEEVGASVIVVGSKSTSTEPRLFAGSTAERLFSGARCPVGIAPHGLRHTDRELRRIGVAYIETPDAEAALDVGARFAARAKASLRLYTVVAGEAEVMPLFIGHDAERANYETASEEFQDALERAIAGLPPGVEAAGEVFTGEVVEVLAELDHGDVDLLFCGSRRYGPLRRVLLGGVSSRLVRRARSPLIVVPRGD